MIVNAAEGALRIVTQNDHAHFAGELLGLWRIDGLPRHPRREELIFAAREHDNGWRETDAAPRCDARRGRPFDFMTLPLDERRDVWRRGARRFVESRPYAALLIVEHALALHRSTTDFDDLLSEWRELRVELREILMVSPEEVAEDYRWIDLTDFLSLVALNRWSEPFERHGYRGRFHDGVLHLDPFPLAGTTSFRVPCRRIPDRAYRGDAILGSEMAVARWQDVILRVAPELPAGDLASASSL